MTREWVKAERLPSCAGNQQHGCHTGGHAGTDGGDIAADELHRIVNAQAGVYRTARRIDIDGDVLARVYRIQVQQLSLQGIGGIVVNLRAQENDAVHHQAGEHVQLGDVQARRSSRI